MLRRKEQEQKQREQERKWREEREKAELKHWALSFGFAGDLAATKIQNFWRGGYGRLITQKGREQQEIEHAEMLLNKEKVDAEALHKKGNQERSKKLRNARTSKTFPDEEQDVEQDQNASGHAAGHVHPGRDMRHSISAPNTSLAHAQQLEAELNEAATKVQAVQRSRKAKKDTEERRKAKRKSNDEKGIKVAFKEETAQPTEDCLFGSKDPEDPLGEMEDAAKKIQAIRRGNAGRKKAGALRDQKSEAQQQWCQENSVTSIRGPGK